MLVLIGSRSNRLWKIFQEILIICLVLTGLISPGNQAQNVVEEEEEINLNDSSIFDNWLQYGDEKYFKVLDDSLRSYTEAQKACAQVQGATLAVIHSQAEQDLLSQYIFEVLGKVDNVWIGGQFSDKRKFQWSDGSPVARYTNWHSRGPHRKPGYCVQLMAEETSLGKWIDEPCGRKNAFVCQKFQELSLQKMQSKFLQLEALLKYTIQQNKRKSSVKVQIPIVHLTKETKNQLKQQEDLFPIGFVYTQLPKSPSPATLWPLMNWSDISATYADAFLRANGPKSSSFGTVQEESFPGVIRVEDMINDPVATKRDFSHYTELMSNPGGNASLLVKRSGYIKSGDVCLTTYDRRISLRFITSTGEVRPRNMAVRIWKRIA